MRFQYVFSEILTGLRRNLTMTIAVVVTVAISLALFGAVCQASFVLISGRGWKPMPTLHVSTYVVGAALAISVPRGARWAASRGASSTRTAATRLASTSG